MSDDSSLLQCDAAALIRAYVRKDAAAFDAVLPGRHNELLLAALGLAADLLVQAVGVEQLDAALQRVIEHNRG